MMFSIKYLSDEGKKRLSKVIADRIIERVDQYVGKYSDDSIKQLEGEKFDSGEIITISIFFDVKIKTEDIIKIIS